MDVESLLKSKGVAYRRIELSDRAISVQDVVNMAKGELNADEICKTIILKGAKFYAFLLKGNERINFTKVKELVQEKVRMATFEEVKEITGVEPGAVCPLLLSIPVFVDEEVLRMEKINFGSGDHLFGIELSTRDLARVIPFTKASVRQEAPQTL
jgi:prolyl-tRNA editing enzyme YbaK/EbsC (Cys-tRNA(Pro) deacylase)